ncbi:thermonuclease family protein [Erysipelothrix urinaevulpis]|uniref:thermonuclease family protein n=1 Tax=Erysipelothrix urinaevulpis TaxID=2683717 RepID=UPI001357C6F3|nr:thermonuclease family protein [Erysipelothrix urinaevulpis]
MKRITKKQQKDMENFIKRNITNKYVAIILLLVIAGGVYYFNEHYLHYRNEAAPVLVANDYKIRCVDGDTFVLNDQKIRMLGIDTPESVKPNHPVEPFGKEASDYTCKKLESAKKIDLKQDKGNEFDKYDRMLAWVYLDDVLLQEDLLTKGFAEIKYINKKTVDNRILDQLKNAESRAKQAKIGIWQ